MQQASATQAQAGWLFFFGREAMMATLLVIDNYDSFTYNLVQMFMRYDLSIQVHRSDGISLAQAAGERPDYVLISPGPKDPAHAGISKALIQALYRTTPILGVCLGMQCINEVFGGRTVRSPAPTHGKTSLVFHHQAALFSQIPSPLRVARYHSLVVQLSEATLERQLEVTACTADKTIMGVSHRRFPLHGVQFHPESFLTEHGFTLVENFLRLGPLKSDLATEAPPPVATPAVVHGLNDSGFRGSVCAENFIQDSH
jgi:anthranilate synthase component 2